MDVMRRHSLLLLVPLLTAPLAGCAPAIHPTMPPWEARVASLWVRPTDIAQRDLFHGPWGPPRAPDPADTYTLVKIKHSGVNPGMTVVDSRGRKWSVKQADPDTPVGEGPIEVVLSRVLSAVGYHQPPVYYVPSFRLRDDWGVRTTGGGRFRLHEETLKERGSWSWHQNPFIEVRAHEGLLTILMMFNASDLKSSNNSLYEYRGPDGREQWYVVRDLGTALGETGRLAPRRGDPELFERSRFIVGIDKGFVRFGYRGRHRELVTDRIGIYDVSWASRLLSKLTEQQWHDAFRAGGFARPVADRYIRVLSARIAHGLALDDDAD